MATLNETPSSNRLHIGIFGKTNSGKSSFINAFTGQNVSIVADVAGTTTDPVYKPMEINPLGACVIIDTAGFDDETELGAAREEKTFLAAEKADIAIIVVAGSETPKTIESELKWDKYFKEKKTPVLYVVNKTDQYPEESRLLADDIREATGNDVVLMSCAQILSRCEVTKDKEDNENIGNKTKGAGLSDNEQIKQIKAALTRMLPENYGADFITGDLVSDGDLVLLVMPQDIQAPKGRLILPQVQTLRELLDKKCLVMSVTTDKLTDVLTRLTEPPKLIITDSQVFDYVYKNKPEESMLTSFSVLFAAYKGDLPYYMQGAKAIDKLTEDSKVLIAECCTHAPLAEDIGRVKIPNMLRKRVGQGLTIDLVSGTDFPEDPSGYDLIIQCGACMFNRKYVLSRIDSAKAKNVPMTNYGVTIAHVTGILDKISTV
ncbi:MAG: [FeFe] hydrogenase H-cluster maturation GTPase HydF [Lachnobacterium sp.]|nr:[FeFe] hydrogenase H-cluster maturation GTPase HydF [Lachnobacterium sp.]MDY2911059.1 [FeFe] hydrogenase H-cluster maturation GTPase HydF [Agathobacter sp.]